MDGYRIRMKSGHIDTDSEGRVIHDACGRDYRCKPHDGWRITGIATRLNARFSVALKDAANGVKIGQGWVRDLDHGTHRLWISPPDRRAVWVERITLESCGKVRP